MLAGLQEDGVPHAACPDADGQKRLARLRALFRRELEKGSLFKGSMWKDLEVGSWSHRAQLSGSFAIRGRFRIEGLRNSE